MENGVESYIKRMEAAVLKANEVVQKLHQQNTKLNEQNQYLLQKLEEYEKKQRKLEFDKNSSRSSIDISATPERKKLKLSFNQITNVSMNSEIHDGPETQTNYNMSTNQKPNRNKVSDVISEPIQGNNIETHIINVEDIEKSNTNGVHINELQVTTTSHKATNYQLHNVSFDSHILDKLKLVTMDKVTYSLLVAPTHNVKLCGTNTYLSTTHSIQIILKYLSMDHIHIASSTLLQYHSLIVAKHLHTQMNTLFNTAFVSWKNSLSKSAAVSINDLTRLIYDHNFIQKAKIREFLALIICILHHSTHGRVYIKKLLTWLKYRVYASIKRLYQHSQLFCMIGNTANQCCISNRSFHSMNDRDKETSLSNMYVNNANTSTINTINDTITSNQLILKKGVDHIQGSNQVTEVINKEMNIDDVIDIDDDILLGMDEVDDDNDEDDNNSNHEIINHSNTSIQNSKPCNIHNKGHQYSYPSNSMEDHTNDVNSNKIPYNTESYSKAINQSKNNDYNNNNNNNNNNNGCDPQNNSVKGVNGNNADSNSGDDSDCTDPFDDVDDDMFESSIFHNDVINLHTTTSTSSTSSTTSTSNNSSNILEKVTTHPLSAAVTSHIEDNQDDNNDDEMYDEDKEVINDKTTYESHEREYNDHTDDDINIDIHTDNSTSHHHKSNEYNHTNNHTKQDQSYYYEFNVLLAYRIYYIFSLLLYQGNENHMIEYIRGLSHTYITHLISSHTNTHHLSQTSTCISSSNDTEKLLLPPNILWGIYLGIIWCLQSYNSKDISNTSETVENISLYQESTFHRINDSSIEQFFNKFPTQSIIIFNYISLIYEITLIFMDKVIQRNGNLSVTNTINIHDMNDTSQIIQFYEYMRQVYTSTHNKMVTVYQCKHHWSKVFYDEYNVLWKNYITNILISLYDRINVSNNSCNSLPCNEADDSTTQSTHLTPKQLLSMILSTADTTIVDKVSYVHVTLLRKLSLEIYVRCEGIWSTLSYLHELNPAPKILSKDSNMTQSDNNSDDGGNIFKQIAIYLTESNANECHDISYRLVDILKYSLTTLDNTLKSIYKSTNTFDINSSQFIPIVTTVHNNTTTSNNSTDTINHDYEIQNDETLHDSTHFIIKYIWECIIIILTQEYDNTMSEWRGGESGLGRPMNTYTTNKMNTCRNLLTQIQHSTSIKLPSSTSYSSSISCNTSTLHTSNGFMKAFSTYTSHNTNTTTTTNTSSSSGSGSINHMIADSHDASTSSVMTGLNAVHIEIYYELCSLDTNTMNDLVQLIDHLHHTVIPYVKKYIDMSAPSHSSTTSTTTTNTTNATKNITAPNTTRIMDTSEHSRNKHYSHSSDPMYSLLIKALESLIQYQNELYNIFSMVMIERLIIHLIYAFIYKVHSLFIIYNTNMSSTTMHSQSTEERRDNRIVSLEDICWIRIANSVFKDVPSPFHGMIEPYTWYQFHYLLHLLHISTSTSCSSFGFGSGSVNRISDNINTVTSSENNHINAFHMNLDKNAMRYINQKDSIKSAMKYLQTLHMKLNTNKKISSNPHLRCLNHDISKNMSYSMYDKSLLPVFVINRNGNMTRWRSCLIQSESNQLYFIRMPAHMDSTLPYTPSLYQSTPTLLSSIDISGAEVTHTWDSTLHAQFDNSNYISDTQIKMTSCERIYAYTHIQLWKTIQSIREHLLTHNRYTYTIRHNPCSDSVDKMNIEYLASMFSSSILSQTWPLLSPTAADSSISPRITPKVSKSDTKNTLQVLDENSDWYLIMNDNIHIIKDNEHETYFLSKIHELLLLYVPSDFDLFYLQYEISPKSTITHINKYIIKSSYLWNSHAYIIRGKCISFLLKRLPITAPLDKYFAQQGYDQYLKIYAVKTPLISLCTHSLMTIPLSSLSGRKTSTSTNLKSRTHKKKVGSK